MKLKRQVILFSVTVMIALLIQAASGLVTLRSASDDDNKARVIQLFKSSYNTIVNLEKMVASGQMEEQRAKSVAIELLRGNIYKSNEYVFVANEDMDFLAAPLDPQLHGTSFHDFKDAGGQSVGQILIDATLKSPSEMAMYEWEQKQEDGSIEKKLSIAQETPLWGWYVGTGIGSKEVNARFVESAQSKVALSILIIALIFALLQAASKSLFNTIGGEPKDVLKAVKDASEGKVYKSFDVQAPSDSIYEAVQRMSSNLAELAENLESSTHSLNSEVCGVESRSAQLKKLSESQQQSTEMIAAAVTEMSASADITSGSASNVASDADLADEKSKSSAQLIRTTVDEITALSIELEGASKAVKNLDTNVNSIVTVLDVIRDIAEQTNLLALNAAIEAARAGEQGRGFAVVADEVRNLASRTQDSTKEIQSMINDLQDGSANALITMSKCAEASRKTVENSEGAEVAISEIVSSLRSISNKTQEIATAAAEQTGASSDISQRINSIETGSSDITDVVVENHEAAKVLGNLSEDLGRWVKQFDVR